MMFESKKIENIEYFKMHYNDESLHIAYKYLSTINLGEEDVKKYMDYLRECEKLGFSFYLYYMDTYEESRELVGFSNFEIKEFSDSHLIDLTAFDDDHINSYFCKIFREEGYFIVSDNTLRKDTYEEKIFTNITKEVLSGERKPHLLLLD